MVNLLLDDDLSASASPFAGCSSSASASMSPSEPDHDDIRLTLLLCCLDPLEEVTLLLCCLDSLAVDAGVLAFLLFAVFTDDDDDDDDEAPAAAKRGEGRVEGGTFGNCCCLDTPTPPCPGRCN